MTGMKIRRRGPLVAIGCAIAALCMASLARAGTPDFHAAQADAYVHYREAVFYTRTGNTPVADLALDQFVTKWAALVERYADRPPLHYAGDQKFGETLRDILARAEEGLAALDVDDTDAAGEAIIPIRDILAELRKRNGLVTWSDLIDELSAAMDILARYRREVKSLDDAETVAMVRAQAAIVAALFERCGREAAPAVASEPEFKRLINGAAESMDKLLESFDTRSMRLYRIGIGELRSYERLMYLRFG